MTRHVCPACHENAPNPFNPGSICDECRDETGVDTDMAELESDRTDTEYRACRTCGSGPFTLAWNAETCHCCARMAREQAERAAIYADATVAVEDEIDDREDIANERAEAEEERERDDEEWAAEQGEEIIEVAHV